MRTATDVIRDIRGGEMVDELGQNLADLTNAVVATGKKGHISIKISISPASKGDCAVTVIDEIKANIPQLAKSETLMFASFDGSLSRQDPRQRNLELQAVTTTTSPLHKAA
ncbi:hypothetical protein HQN60_00075 [Deefgea piscis]|uniref:Uncharacterized protein n=1 Tax=Deefgea piscis TaxID=2739061 RepID=A0A6M8SKW0_9NEIS|nr:hypothetical protein [Deefgea piscis]QKJ65261.1 hypothetical protein HQN60_00075 [Deefgea piscis]